ncbi:MAG: type II secretion system minor pseudopilin GspJ [Woeseiaceae bacterium]|nr:type II secretion system minor pseudopilin GspJ [Woeseiaceae bacterium]
MNRNNDRGFTLIEVLVALAVFGILTILAYATLGQTLSNADLLNTRMERLKAVQRAVRVIDADLMQAAPRPIRDPLTEGERPAFMSDAGLDFAIELTHLGWNNPAGLPRSNQQRSAYRVEDGELVRYHWVVLDRTLANEPLRAVLLDGVESLTFLFQKPDGEWVPTWPARSVQLAPNPQSRPRAVEVLLTLTNEGEIRRLLEIAP